MKLIITINQDKLLELAPDANLSDGAILEYVFWFCASPSLEVEKYRITAPDGLKYTWVDYEKLLSDLPILRIKSKSSITPIFKRLEEWGFIKSYSPDNQRKYIAVLPKFDELFVKLNSFGKPFVKTNSSVRENEQSCSASRTNKDISNKDIIDINIPFENFWNLYDKKVGRPKSEKKWNKLNDRDRKAVMDYLPGYIKATPDKQYRKNPETFLNNRSWEDEVVKYLNNKGGIEICHDGTKARMVNGRWVDANDPTVEINLSYYPELAKK
jgi:DNA-binding PadR family transcriptional regulator